MKGVISMITGSSIQFNGPFNRPLRLGYRQVFFSWSFAVACRVGRSLSRMGYIAFIHRSRPFGGRVRFIVFLRRWLGDAQSGEGRR